MAAPSWPASSLASGALRVTSPLGRRVTSGAPSVTSRTSGVTSGGFGSVTWAVSRVTSPLQITPRSRFSETQKKIRKLQKLIALSCRGLPRPFSFFVRRFFVCVDGCCSDGCRSVAGDPAGVSPIAVARVVSDPGRCSPRTLPLSVAPAVVTGCCPRLLAPAVALAVGPLAVGPLAVAPPGCCPRLLLPQAPTSGAFSSARDNKRRREISHRRGGGADHVDPSCRRRLEGSACGDWHA